MGSESEKVKELETNEMVARLELQAKSMCRENGSRKGGGAQTEGDSKTERVRESP